MRWVGKVWNDGHLAFGQKFTHMDKGGSTWIWQQCDTGWVVFWNGLSGLKWQSQHTSNLMGSDPFVLENKFMYAIHMFICFAWLIDVPSVWQLQQWSHHFWSWKTTEKLVFFLVSALQKLLSTFWSFSSIFLSFKGIVMHILFAGSDIIVLLYWHSFKSYLGKWNNVFGLVCGHNFSFL